MANEILVRYFTTGVNLYALVFNPDSRVWSTVAGSFVVLVAADWANYDLPLAETPSGGYLFKADFPTAIETAGDYEVVIFQRIGGSPAITDPQLTGGTLLWDGQVEVQASSLFPSLVAGSAGVSDPSAGAV